MTEDGIHGTDSNVESLLPDRPSAAGVPPQPEVIEELEIALAQAKAGKITGLIMLGFDDTNSHKVSLTGKIQLSHSITGLEQLKFGILARDYAKVIIK